MTPENPPGPIVRIEIGHAAFQNGWLIEKDLRDGWYIRASSKAPGDVAIAGAGPKGPWFLAVDHPGVAEELGFTRADMPGPGIARFVLPDERTLHEALSRAWDLAVSLPDHPLRQFRAETAGLPRETEAERLVVQRKGQDIFRESLMAYWGRRCPLTGVRDEALLRASHMKPWAQCETDAERLDPHNGLLLSALWDAAFDAGLVSFDDGGRVLRASALSETAATALGAPPPLALTDKHRRYLIWHRTEVFKG